MPALLETKGLSAGYGATNVLREVAFQVEEGGITTVLGANGAGKTTLLRAVCGMIRRSGDIRFSGQTISGRATEDIVRLGIAHVPDGRGTFVDLTTEENLRVGAYTRRDKQAVAKDLERVYGYFPKLKERRQQQAGTLSGGEQQMLAVARALMLRPRLLLLDEPSFGLAPLIVQDIFRIMRRINQEDGGKHVAGGTKRHAGPGPRDPRLCARDRAGCRVRAGRVNSQGRVGAAVLSWVLRAGKPSTQRREDTKEN
jgi:branched-chain amino acid transport system ATP-binding protein